MKLTITKFKRIENMDFSIPATISGGNGLGKTTILEAISFVFTGKALDGKELETVYDNRFDIHDAIADVTFIDAYGNSIRRVVSPTFQTNRQGVEELKIKRSTQCYKNGIECTDYASEYADFYKFGTDYFFNQKEDAQRSIFIDLLKSKLPTFDVNEASLKLKEQKKAQKAELSDVKLLNAELKDLKDVVVPTISDELQKFESKYAMLSGSSNADSISQMNKANHEAMDAYFKKKKELNDELNEAESNIIRLESYIKTMNGYFPQAKDAFFTPKKKEDELSFVLAFEKAKEDLAFTSFYESIEEYARLYMKGNPICAENIAKIKAINAEAFAPSTNDSPCPLSGEVCSTAKLYSEVSEKMAFEKTKANRIDTLKAENRAIVMKEMSDLNQRYYNTKGIYERAERMLDEVRELNASIDAKNDREQNEFASKKEEQINEMTHKVEVAEKNLLSYKQQKDDVSEEIASLEEPMQVEIGESVTISEELKLAHAEYESAKESIIGAKAINANNAEKRSDKQAKIKAKQATLIEIEENIVTLQAQISEYFSKLTDIVESEFKGSIKIGVELLEYVMSRDEYKDVFRITADGKAFPYECNGALINNVKLQVLANMQRLKDYAGITIMDNCEANTTQPIDKNGLNVVLGMATLEDKLTIKN